MTSIDASLVPEMADLACGPETKPLWESVEGLLKGKSEADFVKTVIGPELLSEIDVSREELNSLLSILSDMREGGGRPEASGSPHRLPHPPGLGMGNVSLLHQRLKVLLENAREPIEAVAPTPREKMVAQYILSGAKRPLSSSGRPGTGQRPFSRGSMASRGSSRPTSATGSSSGSSHFDPTAELQPLAKQLRFDLVHLVKNELQELFRNEKQLLLEDIDFIRGAIEEEMTWSRFTELTAKELSSMSAALEKKNSDAEYAEQLNSLPTPLSRGRSLPALHQPPSKLSSATPVRPAAPPGARSPNTRFS